MKQLIFLIFLCLTFSLCFGQNQGELNDNANKNFKKVDKELNSVYQNILKEYKADTAFINSFKTAQRIWIQFRDAEMKAKYPHNEDGYYGSVHPMCWSMYLTELTQERIKKLKVWLTGIEEGDVCTGSVKIKQ